MSGPATVLKTTRRVPIELRGATLAQERPRFRLVLVALDSPIPATARLRRFLKAALRAYRLRCTSVEEI